MLSMLVAYDADGNIIATLDYMVMSNDNDEPVGLIDFEEHENAGGKLTDVWNVEGADGSAVWPEWIGSKAHDFKVERAAGKVVALVHKQSGHRRDKAEIKGRIQARIKEAKGGPADIRDIVGGPERPLLIGDDGRTKDRPPRVRPNLPVAALDNLSRGGNRGNKDSL